MRSSQNTVDLSEKLCAACGADVPICITTYRIKVLSLYLTHTYGRICSHWYLSRSARRLFSLRNRHAISTSFSRQLRGLHDQCSTPTLDASSLLARSVTRATCRVRLCLSGGAASLSEVPSVVLEVEEAGYILRLLNKERRRALAGFGSSESPPRDITVHKGRCSRRGRN